MPIKAFLAKESGIQQGEEIIIRGSQHCNFLLNHRQRLNSVSCVKTKMNLVHSYISINQMFPFNFIHLPFFPLNPLSHLSLACCFILRPCLLAGHKSKSKNSHAHSVLISHTLLPSWVTRTCGRPHLKSTFRICQRNEAPLPVPMSAQPLCNGAGTGSAHREASRKQDLQREMEPGIISWIAVLRTSQDTDHYWYTGFLTRNYFSPVNTLT